MFFKKISNMKWQQECDLSVPYTVMTVQISFSHAEQEFDETELCIGAWDKKELTELFEAFCKENNFKNVKITAITVVRVARSMDELTKMEEK